MPPHWTSCAAAVRRSLSGCMARQHLLFNYIRNSPVLFVTLDTVRPSACFHVPHALRETLERALERARSAGVDKIDLGNDAPRDHVAEWIGRRLEVSARVVLRRASDDGLLRR